MIDLHFHCLPGIDDGPKTFDEAVALCRAAAGEGIETVVATPHVLRDAWSNEEPAVRDGLILRLNTLLGGRPAVLAGCEYYFSSEMLELVERGSAGPLTGLNRGQYLLVELPPSAPTRTTEAVFHELSILGVTPVVAHPERHPVFRREPRALERLLSLGAVAQLTAGSLLGDFGERAKASSNELLRRGLVSLVASDSHSLELRPPRLAAAREHVRRLWGEEAEQGLFEANPEAVLASRPMPWTPAAERPAGRVMR